MTKFWYDIDGALIKSTSDNINDVDGAVGFTETETFDGNKIWNGSAWVYPLVFMQNKVISDINDLRDEKKGLTILSEGYEVDSGDLDVGTMATKIYASTLNGTQILSITNSGGIATATTAKVVTHPSMPPSTASPK